MPDLIIHVGPPKCGSSSIQQFFSQANPCQEKLLYKYVSSPTVDAYNSASIDTQGHAQFRDFIKKLNRLLDSYESVVLSNEYFFECKYSIKNICQYSQAANIKIIGYSRRQSDLFISSFSQWEFRNSQIKSYIANTLISNGIDPTFFLGIESFLIAIILSGFKMELRPHNWNAEYQSIEDLCQDHDAIVEAGCLPTKTRPFNLVEDFCSRAKLTIKPGRRSDQFSNLRFDYRLIESFYNAPAGLKELISEHKYNDFFSRLSAELGHQKIPKTDFITNLCNYIDSAFMASNAAFCEKYNIPPSAFTPSTEITSSDIKNIIRDELNERRVNCDKILSRQKEISGSLAHMLFHQQLLEHQSFPHKINRFSNNFISRLKSLLSGNV